VRGALRRVVERAVDIARRGGSDSGTGTGTGTGTGAGIDVHVLGSGSGSSSESDSRNNVACELHVSLTRPFFLRAYQREEMKRAVRDAAKAHPP
jgi:hypothetical protein